MVGLTWVICRFGNVCTVEEDGMCAECVSYFDDMEYLYGDEPDY